MTAAADPALPLDGQPDELAIQRAGLAAIRSGQHLTPIELGVAADVDPMRAQAIIDGLLGRQAATVSGGRVDGIAFRCMDGDLGPALLRHDGAPFHVAGKLRLNNWQGRTSVQVMIDDAAPVW